MSNYTKTTDFAAKDSLPTGDSAKIIRGSEFETEFDAISTAIATKSDTAGPTFTGTLTFATISDGTINVTAFVDEDNMASNSATLVPTQQSVKAYVDAQLTAEDLDFQADSGGALSIDLDSETLTFTGGTGIDTSGSGNAVTFAIDSTVTTLAGSQTLTNKTLTSPVLNTGVSGTAVLDEDDMSSNSATQLATQQSIKAYVDTQITAEDLDFQADSGGALSIDLDSETLTFTGGTGIDTSGSGNAVTFAIDSTVATLTGSQTLTNKSLTAPTLTGTAVVASLDISGDIDVDGTTNLDVVDIDGAVDFASTTAHAGNASFADNARVILGTGSDLQIYHTGSVSVIEDSGTGNLLIRGTDMRLQNAAGDNNYFKAVDGAEVELMHGGATKLATTSTGIDVTGTVTATGTSVFASLDISGDIDVDGTTNLDVVDIDGAVDMASTLAVGGLTTITTANNSAQLILKSTDADANVGPRLDLTRDSASPADGDAAGQIRFMADNDAGEETSFGFIRATLDDVSDGSEDGSIDIQTIVAGTSRSRIQIGSTETVLNEASQDLDFRVESDGKTHMLFVDAGNNHVNIGTSTDRSGLLNIETNDNTSQLVLVSTDDDANVGPRMDFIRDSASPADDDIVSQIRFRGKNDASEELSYATIKVVASDVSDGTEDSEFQINTIVAGASSNLLTINSTEIVLNEGSKDTDFRVESNGNTHGLFVDAGNNRVGILNSSPAFALDVTGAIATSSGLYVGGTVGANLLDDYEHGSWTPVADFSTTSPSSGATTGTGRYVKVGNLVTVWGTITNINVSGAAGDVNITGLPFTARLATNIQRYIGTIRTNSVDFSGVSNPIGVFIQVLDNETVASPQIIRGGAGTDGVEAGICSDGTTDFSLTLTYETSA